MVWGEIKFAAKKIGEIQWASTEVLEDSAVDLRRIIADNLLRDASLKFDSDAFTGSGANPIKGIVAQGTSTTLGAGKVTVTYDDLADSVSRIEAVNGRPSVVWASTDMAAALRKEKAPALVPTRVALRPIPPLRPHGACPFLCRASCLPRRSSLQMLRESWSDCAGMLR
ncbi:phage major capsid protein [Streptomyces sp. ISL-99]|nr:phage major capsid protein [Streptomyces sp. ISL-99]